VNWLLLKNSLLVSAGATLTAVVLGWVAALWVAGLPGRWRSGAVGAAIVALALPPFLVTNCWLDLLGTGGGYGQWLPLPVLSLAGAIWILALMLWPITLLAVLGAWQRLEPAQLESDMAVTGWPLMRVLLWPLARPALGQAALLTLVLALNNFAVPAILQVKVFPAEMWVLFNTSFDTAGALRMSLPLILGPLLLLAVFARREFPWPHWEAAVSARLFRQQLGATWFWGAGGVALLLCLFADGLPLLQLVTARRTWTELPGAWAAGQTAVWNSVGYSTATATLVLAGGLLRAAFRRRAMPAVSWMVWLPFLLPGVLLGIGLIEIFNHPWSALFYQSAGIVILAMGIRYLAIGTSTSAAAVARVDRELLDVARLEGASRWQLLRYVQWPQIAPQAAAAWYVVYLLCLWDVESLILVVPPGGETLALRIFNLLHYGHNAQVNALCLALLGVALAPWIGWKIWTAGPARRGSADGVARAAWVVAFAGLLLLTSCTGRATAGGESLPSEIFNRVEVIGTRGVGVGQLNKPRSVTVDLADNLYVVDMTGRVQKFSPQGEFLLSWQMPQTDLGKPKGMGRDRAGRIIVVEPHYSRVNLFGTNGQLIAQWGQRGTNAGQLSLPRAVAVNSFGEFFVSEYQEAERVQKFIFDAGVEPGKAAPRFLGGFGKAGTGLGEFNRPEGLSCDAQDRVYVADSCNHRIQVFARDGTFIRAYGKAGQGLGELSYPYDICVDAAGRQYVCEFGNSRIQVFDARDRPIEIIGGPGAGPGRFSNPWGVALDSAGNLYVADSQNHRVQKLLRTQALAAGGPPSTKRSAP